MLCIEARWNKLDYQSSGVDTQKAQQLIHALKNSIASTHKNLPHGKVGGSFGSYAGIFEPANSLQGHHLVAATDGVGTKIELCKKYNYLEPLGYDLTAMCVNDLYCTGATPLFFLDYISCGKLDHSWYNPIINSLALALRSIDVALLGGETAEHPGTMKEEDFDLAGFCVGSLDPAKQLPKVEKMQTGDWLIAFASNGLHSNGFSLVRKIFSQIEESGTKEQKQKIDNHDWVKKNVLAPTKIYRELSLAMQEIDIKGMAHITGGGIYENLPRILPEHLSANIENAAPFSFEIFDFIGQFVSKENMYHTFNMGMGMIVITNDEQGKKLLSRFSHAKKIGSLIAGNKKILIKDAT